MTLTVTFEIGTNPDQNAINVNNRVQRALPLLPGEVSRQGLVVQKRSTSILQGITMASQGDRYDTIYISNYALVNVLDELRRLPGVGDAALFGASDYSMRIWLRPDKLAQYNLTPADIAGVVREQNQQFAAGRFGEEPMNKPQVFTYSVTTPPPHPGPNQQVPRRPLGGGADEQAAGLHLLGDDPAAPGRPHPVRGHHHP